MTAKQGLTPTNYMITDWKSRVALGIEEGVTTIHKFGRNPDISTTEEDVWNVGGKETLPTTGTTMWIASEDNVNGVGQTIRVVGLDDQWGEQTVDVVLTGNTPAQIGDALGWTRIFRVYQVSAEPDPVGDLWVGDDDTDFLAGVPQTASTIHAKVEFTNAAQQTEKAMYTVPANHIAILHDFGAQIGTPSGASRTARVAIEVQEPAVGGGWTPWRRIDQHDMISDGDSSFDEEYNIPLGVFPPRTNIHIRATASASSIILADMTITVHSLGS